MFASRGTAPSFTIEVKSDNSGTSGTDQFTIPTTTGTYLYDYTTSDGQSGTGITGNTTITFASGAGTYEIYITGTFPRIYFNNAGDEKKLLRVLQWGIYGVGETNQDKAFLGCGNLTSIAEDVDNINLITSATSIFQNCALTALPSGLIWANLITGGSAIRNNLLTSLPSGMTLNSLQNGEAMLFSNSLTDLPTGVTLPALTNGAFFLNNNTINTTRYSQLLVDLESGNVNNGVTFSGGNSLYNATGETARNILTGGVRLWTITDGGLEP